MILSKMLRLFWPVIAAVLIAPVFSEAQEGAANTEAVVIIATDDILKITINGEPFTEYHFDHPKRPFFYPVIGPGGVAMTRNYPMGYAEGEARDHVHHTSLWFGHGSINGFDFWEEQNANSGHVEHAGFTEISSGEIGVIRTKNNYVSSDGEIVVSDERVMRIHNRDDGARMMDFEITFRATDGDIVFGDTKEGTMALRLNPHLRLRGEVGEGHIVNSEGQTDGDTWGKRAAWCDYYGPINGRTVGVAIFDHPDNPRHPTWWHVRDYGLFAANPFGTHDFENKPAGTGDFTVSKGESVTFKYRVLFHEGDPESAKIAEEYEKFKQP